MGGGGSKEVDAGTWYFVATHEGLSLGPIDAFLQWNGGSQVAWTGEMTASGAIAVHKPNLFGGEKDQGGVDGTLRLMFGDADQMPNAYLTSVFGSQQAAWRGFMTVAWEGGKYGANNPYPQKPSYKIRKITKGWDDDTCWYVEKAEIPVATPSSLGLYLAMDCSGSMSTVTSNGETRLANMQSAVQDVLDYVKAVCLDRGGHVDICLVSWAAGHDSNTKLSATASDITALKTWVGALVASGGTDFRQAFSGLADFYATSSAAKKLVIFLTDGVPDSPAETVASSARALVNAVGATAWAANIDLSDTTYTSYIDNTASDGVPVVAGGNPAALTSIVIRAISAGAVGMNPAHILYFLRTSRERGREPAASMADDSLRAAADWFYNQGFGLCGTRKAASVSPAEYEQQIQRVAGCSFSRSTLDGKFYIDIANGEYDLESLPILSDDDVLGFKEIPTVLDNAINSVSVKYFDPKQKRSITSPAVRALALISAFGENHQTYDFPEVPTAALANRIAQRELLAAVTPTRRFELDCNRTPEGWRRFQYFRLQLPKRGIADMVCLVGDNADGKLKSGGIKLMAVQDTYSVDTTTYIEGEAGVDTRPSQEPVVITVQRAFEAPYIDVCTRFSSSELADLPPDAGFLAALALDPATSRDFSLYVAPDGGDYVEYSTEDFCPSATINEAAPLDGTGAAPATDFTFSNGLRLMGVTVGMPAIWGEEWCRVDAIDTSAGTVSLARGCADTVPREHDAGERIFFYADHAASDGKEHVAGETIAVKLLTNTGSERLPVASATPISLTFDQRVVRPYPPGKVQIDGAYYPAAVADEFTVTWTHRNRQLQADQLVDTTMASVALPNNTRYGLRFLDASDMLLVERTDIGAGTATVALNYTGDVTMELYTIDDVAESMQRHVVTFAYSGVAGNTIDADAYVPVYDGIIVDGGA